jgi:hypothetical protein
MNRAGTIGTPTGDGGRGGAAIVRAGFRISENGPAVPVAPEVSATETENVDVPVVVGVPEMTPVVAPNESPAGRLPLERVQVYGAVPPDAVKAAVLYGTLTVPGGRAGATIASVMIQVEGSAVATASTVSWTEIVKLYDPTLVGVPLSTPVLAPIMIPGGRAPVETKNRYGGTPPDAVNAAVVTGTPKGEGGRTGAAIVSGGGLTINERGAVAAVRSLLSTTPTTKVNEPVLVGVPLKTPEVGFSDMPCGSDPDETDHVKGGVPPAT